MEPGLIDHSQAFLSSHYLEDDDEKLPNRFDRQLVARLEELDLEYMQFRFGRLLLDPQIRAIIMRRDALMRRIDKLVAEKGEEACCSGSYRSINDLGNRSSLVQRG